MPDDLIKKSIRLPADLDEYVNSQKGTTWTDKLCRILEDYRSGDETRAVYMADYEKRMAANSKKIQEQNSQIYTVARSLDHLHRALEDLNSLPFTYLRRLSVKRYVEYRNRRPCGEDMPRKPLYRLAPPDTSPPGEQEPPLLLFPCALTAVITGPGTGPWSPEGRYPPPGGALGQPQTRNRKEC